MTNLNGQITLKSVNLMGYKPGEGCFYVQNTSMGADGIPAGSSDRTGKFLRSIAKWLDRISYFDGTPALGIKAHRIPKFIDYCGRHGYRVVVA